MYVFLLGSHVIILLIAHSHSFSLPYSSFSAAQTSYYLTNGGCQRKNISFLVVKTPVVRVSRSSCHHHFYIQKEKQASSSLRPLCHVLPALLSLGIYIRSRRRSVFEKGKREQLKKGLLALSHSQAVSFFFFFLFVLPAIWRTLPLTSLNGHCLHIVCVFVCVCVKCSWPCKDDELNRMFFCHFSIHRHTFHIFFLHSFDKC